MFERRPGAACFLVRPISEAAAIEAMIELLANRATTTPCASPTAAPHRERGQGRRGDPVSGRKGEQDAGEVAASDGANRLPDSVTSARPAAATPTGKGRKEDRDEIVAGYEVRHEQRSRRGHGEGAIVGCRTVTSRTRKFRQSNHLR